MKIKLKNSETHEIQYFVQRRLLRGVIQNGSIEDSGFITSLAIGRLLDKLASQDLLTAPEICEISSGVSEESSLEN